jgi:hypothetical protein
MEGSMTTEYQEALHFCMGNTPEVIARSMERDMLKIKALESCQKELAHLVRLMEPIEKEGGFDIPGLATLNGARAALAKAESL